MQCVLVLAGPQLNKHIHYFVCFPAEQLWYVNSRLVGWLFRRFCWPANYGQAWHSTGKGSSKGKSLVRFSDLTLSSESASLNPQPVTVPKPLISKM